MYGFGDDPEPLDESVSFLEQATLEYLQTLLNDMGQLDRGKGDLTVDGLLFVLRKDPNKLGKNDCAGNRHAFLLFARGSPSISLAEN